MTLIGLHVLPSSAIGKRRQSGNAHQMLQLRHNLPVSTQVSVSIRSHEAMPTVKEVGIILASGSREEPDIVSLSLTIPVIPCTQSWSGIGWRYTFEGQMVRVGNLTPLSSGYMITGDITQALHTSVSLSVKPDDKKIYFWGSRENWVENRW